MGYVFWVVLYSLLFSQHTNASRVSQLEPTSVQVVKWTAFAGATWVDRYGGRRIVIIPGVHSSAFMAEETALRKCSKRGLPCVMIKKATTYKGCSYIALGISGKRLIWITHKSPFELRTACYFRPEIKWCSQPVRGCVK